MLLLNKYMVQISCGVLLWGGQYEYVWQWGFYCHKSWSFLSLLLEQWERFQYQGRDYCAWGVLYCASGLSIESLHVFGDSKVVIGLVKEWSELDPPMLINWMNRIRLLIGRFCEATFFHIYRENNGVANALLKVGHRYLSREILCYAYFNDNLQRNIKIDLHKFSFLMQILLFPYYHISVQMS